MTKILLLLLLALIVMVNSVPDGSSGSGDPSSLMPDFCSIPPYSDPSRISVNPTDQEMEQLMIEGRCFLACTSEEVIE